MLVTACTNFASLVTAAGVNRGALSTAAPRQPPDGDQRFLHARRTSQEELASELGHEFLRGGELVGKEPGDPAFWLKPAST